MSLERSSNSSTASEITTARQADHIAFLHRLPFAADALALGYLPDLREDCGYQETQYQNLNLPVGMLDNDFRNPDLERFVDRFFEYEPEVGVIGDVDEIDAADRCLDVRHRPETGTPEEVVSDRMNSSRDVIEQHYDERSEREKMWLRREFLEGL